MTLAPDEKGTWHSLDRTQPKYARVKSYLLRELTEGRLRPGEVLPPELRLAESLQVARTTVRQALAELEQDGLIRRVQGESKQRQQPQANDRRVL